MTPTGLSAMPYELFISYFRMDNVSKNPSDPLGWVTTIRDYILTDHRRFFDVLVHVSIFQSAPSWVQTLADTYPPVSCDHFLPFTLDENLMLTEFWTNSGHFLALLASYKSRDYCLSPAHA